MSEISLTSSMRANLSSLRMISGQMGKTQKRLSTGLKVNSAIDNASSYYQARSLNNRASDLETLLDGMGQGIQTIQAANEGIEHGLAFLEQMKSVVEQTAAGAKNAPISAASTVALENNVDELVAQGYTAITKDMTAEEIQDLLDTDGAKLVLADDITIVDDGLYVYGADVTINGGGHTLSFRGEPCLKIYNDGAEISNMRIDYADDGQYGNCAVYSDNMFTMRNVDIVYKNASGGWYTSGVDAEMGCKLENVNITVDSRYEGQISGVYTYGGSSTLKNVSINLSGGKDTLLVGVWNDGEDMPEVTLEGVGLNTKGGYSVLGTFGGVVNGVEPVTTVKTPLPASFYDGRGNTQAIINQIGSAGLAATAANQFYAPGVAQNDADFGAGQWYLPSIGELMELYGYDTAGIESGWGTSGATGENKALVNAALAKLGGDAAQLTDDYYWSSSEDTNDDSWELDMFGGDRSNYSKGNAGYVRIFQLVENCFYPFNSSEAASGSEGTGGLSAPKIGDVMYSDKSYGSADDYAAAKAAGKIAVGIVCDVNEGDGSVKIVNLKDLRFTSYRAEGNFNAADPYKGSTVYCQWATRDKWTEDIEGIKAVSPAMVLASFRPDLVVSADDINNTFAKLDTEAYSKQFDTILGEYDKLIADASYQGINLLKGGRLNVTFNETRSHRFTVQGADISSEALGIRTAEWENMADVEKALSEIQGAISTLRDLSTELGNNYQIIQTRQNFTDALIDVLETGSDNLVLADMNEESANYLALQTRQQLAINSLSLAAQSAQSILSLF